MQEVTNFARFYAALNRVQYAGEREELKKSVVRQYTLERTDSLREMTREEYDGCCAALEKITGYKDEMKKERSVCLRLMQKIGVDTSDWARVNNFCEHPRIAGKAFARLSVKELEALEVKLRAIKRKGGLKKRPTPSNTPSEGEKSGGVMLTYMLNMSEMPTC